MLFLTQNKNILIAIYVMRLDTNWGNCINYESARYANVMKKCGFHRCHLTWIIWLSCEIISKSKYFVLANVCN